jgi:hypothetical protein
VTDDLIAQLRKAGHEAEAASIERKGIAAQLREAGRSDLADEVEGNPPAEEHDPSSVSAFGADEDADVRAVVAALDRDIPDWRR